MSYEIYSKDGADAAFAPKDGALDGGTASAPLYDIRIRHDDTAGWAAEDPILAAGEPAVVLDSGQPAELVLGDGVTAMADLRAAVWDDDARLTDDRDPTAHTHPLADVTDAGTAAAADVGDFATAAQGAKADTAVQPGGLTKAAVGLGNVDNTADADKPASVPQTAAFAGRVMTTHAIKLSDAKRAKGARIGTNGRPVISFRIDHGIDQFLATFWPLFKARGIPCSVGIVTDAIGNASDPYEPSTTSWATLLAEHRKGFEVWAHSRSHLDLPATGHTLVEEVLGSRDALVAQGFKVTGWQQPGVPGVVTPHYSNNWDGDWTSDYGQMILGGFPFMEMSGIVGGAARVLPTGDDYDLAHYTLDGLTYTSAKAILDNALGYGLSSQWMLHPKFISAGTVTATTADITNFLDYVKTLWDAGTIEVLTASGLAVADPAFTGRLDIAQDGSFETVTTIPSGGSTPPWGYAGGTGTGLSVNTDGGHDGPKYLHIPASASFTYVYQGCAQIRSQNLQGTTMIAEVWARATVANTDARITLLDPDHPTELNYEVPVMLTAGAGWSRIRAPFSIPLSTTNLQVKLSRKNGTGDIDFDCLTVRPI